ncbi:hypothetical protein ANCCAN_09315 [Ancylostoma caninum]|uniref:Uncharacterized protein n=1 Tax=Ancylostoma caninum TaxID=29170 RepID=A0A368GNL9_ANCCA|nr:hypothetical protein ANCCAN_09315 [Ancylostoma caninum]
MCRNSHVFSFVPRLARLLTKAFPAYVILAAFRYYDHAHDETALTGLFSTLHIMLKDTVTQQALRSSITICNTNAVKSGNGL